MKLTTAAHRFHTGRWQKTGRVAHEALGAHAAEALLAVEPAPEEVEECSAGIAVPAVKSLVSRPGVGRRTSAMSEARLGMSVMQFVSPIQLFRFREMTPWGGGALFGDDAMLH